MDKIKLNQIELLVAAVDAGSFSAASAELGCTQSRISHSIAELERNLGVRLLVRTRTGCTPTHAGQRVLARARQMLHLVQDIVQESQENLDIHGTVRIACIRSAATHLLPHVVESLERDCPGVYLEIFDDCQSYDSVTAMLEQGRADIGITRGFSSTALRTEPLLSDRYVVVAPAAKKLKSPACWKELADIPFINIQQPGSQWIVEQCVESGMLNHRVRELANESGIVAMVKRGLGYAILPQLTVFPDVQGTQIITLPFIATRNLIVCRAYSRHQSKTIDAVVQCIRSKSLIMRTEAWQHGVINCDL